MNAFERFCFPICSAKTDYHYAGDFGHGEVALCVLCLRAPVLHALHKQDEDEPAAHWEVAILRQLYGVKYP